MVGGAVVMWGGGRSCSDVGWWEELFRCRMVGGAVVMSSGGRSCSDVGWWEELF